MINNKYHEYRYDSTGRRVLIDACDLREKGGLRNNSRYEVVAMDALTMQDIVCKRVDTLEEVEEEFAKQLLIYCYDDKPLTGKYAKLRDDLKIAMAAGRRAETEEPDDGGTCNFDSPCIKLPRWQHALIQRAAKEAGSNAMEWDLYGDKRWVFSPDTRAQGNARTVNAEAMYKKLKELGYAAGMYYQMD